MVEEYNSIMTNDVWEVVPRPQNKSVVGSRWIYKIKYDADGNIEKFKPRFRSSIHFNQIRHLSCSINGMGDSPDGCQDNVLEWGDRRGSVNRTVRALRRMSRRLMYAGLRKPCTN